MDTLVCLPIHPPKDIWRFPIWGRHKHRCREHSRLCVREHTCLCMDLSVHGTPWDTRPGVEQLHQKAKRYDCLLKNLPNCFPERPYHRAFPSAGLQLLCGLLGPGYCRHFLCSNPSECGVVAHCGVDSHAPDG